MATALALLLSAPAAAAKPVTAAADSLRTAWYPDEPQLTPQLLESGGFGLNFSTEVQGQVYAQPLVSGNTLLVATEENWIYGINAQSGEVEWDKQVGTPWNSEHLSCADLAPHVGITGTPVIDPVTNVAYFFAKTYASGGEGPAEWQMHAIDLSNGEEEKGFPVTISGEAENLPEEVEFDPTHQLERPGLLLMNGVVYAGFGSHCDEIPFHGWLVGVSTKTAQITTMWATTAHNGAAIWQGGGGLVSDREGQILFATGNSWSPPDGLGNEPPEGHLGDSVVRVQVSPEGTAAATDFFAPYNSEELDEEDLDLGSGAPIALPTPYFGTTEFPHLLVEVGKSGVVYLLNRDELGGKGQKPEGKNLDLGETSIPNGVWGSLATWPGDGGYVYAPAQGETPGNGALEVLKYGTDEAGKPELISDARAPGLEFGSGSPIVTSNGTTPGSGIVWVSQCSEAFTCHGSTLNAYSAVPTGGEPMLLWSHEIGISTKFARPDASGSRVYVGTRDGHILAFGTTHHLLTVQREGEAGGSVSSNAAGIDCGSSCSHSFADGESVTLTATPASHFEFTGWSGGACSGTGRCHLAMYSDATVTARFAAIVHSVTVSKSGPGSVVSSPPGIDCGSSCSHSFADGESVTLTATPASHFEFTGWSGGACSGTGRCHLAMYSDATVTARFAAIVHSVTVSKSGPGSVVSSPPGIDCGATCSTHFDEAASVTLEAAPEGSTAVIWSGCTSSAGRACHVADLEADREVRAVFLSRPGTKLTRVRIDRRRRRASFRFRGTAATSGFQCRLVRVGSGRRRGSRPRFSRCANVKACMNLARGRYRFEVRAVNAAGPDRSPARRRFRI